MYEGVVMLLFAILVPAILLYRKGVGGKKSIVLGRKTPQCRIICTDRMTQQVSEQAWFGLDREKFLEESIKNFKNAPKLGNMPFSDRYEFTIDHA